MNIIIDTNVLISAFVFKGNCEKVLEVCYGKFNLVISTWILQEIKKVLQEKFEIPDHKIDNLLNILSKTFAIVTPDNELPQVCRDNDDNNILQLSDFVDADYIITGDSDLIILKSYKKAKIVNPKMFLELFGE